MTQDNRGKLIKIYNGKPIYKECFYSVSKKGVIRGMHRQGNAEKRVFITKGSALDVVVNPMNMHWDSKILKEGDSAFIPKGWYHGFLALEENTCMVYLQSEIYKPEDESGIRYDSFGFNWNIQNPILSERDKKL